MSVKLHPAALLFDMDGVLIDSLDAWWEGFNESLRHFKQKEISKEEFIKTYWGYDLRSNLRRVGLPAELAEFCNRSYTKHVDSIVLFENVHETLEKLSDYKKALITNTPRVCLDKILERFSLRRYFDAVVTSDDVSNAKPDPEIVYKACEQLEVLPKNTVLIGDTTSDVQAGRAAGCIVIGVNIKGDEMIDHISKLHAMLE